MRRNFAVSAFKASYRLCLVPLSILKQTVEHLNTMMHKVQALQSLSVADNKLTQLPAGLSRLMSLMQLWAYGNQLQSCHPDILTLPLIKSKLTLSTQHVCLFR